ncbi:hypothetical protein H6761_03505 [Candidatus Nomurabacteria bacterium]|nr:hypothetical protein [Candidatus Nomurabacteria bacterium]
MSRTIKIHELLWTACDFQRIVEIWRDEHQMRVRVSEVNDSTKRVTVVDCESGIRFEFRIADITKAKIVT